MLQQVAPGVRQLGRQDASGWRVTMTLLDLGGGGLLVHSPTWVGDDTPRLLASAGTPRFLLAPNHFHHLSLGRFRQQWPEAQALAAPQALPRLSRRGHAGLLAVGAEALDLGPVRLHPAAGTRTGETWVSANETLVVCDAFFNLPGPLRGAMGAVLKATRTGPGLRLGRTFRWLALDEPKTYRAWAEAKLEELRPTRVVFSHGDPIEGGDVVERLQRALREALE